MCLKWAQVGSLVGDVDVGHHAREGRKHGNGWDREQQDVIACAESRAA